MSFTRSMTIAVVFGGLFATAQAQNLHYQGFETNTGDWTGTIARVASGAGVLAVPSFEGKYHAELTNNPGSYSAGYGGDHVTRFDHPFPNVLPYTGPYVISLSMYIYANTPVASNPSVPGVWIDMAPRDTDTGFSNFDGEHNFRLTSTGSQVDVRVDGQTNILASLTQSGWYTFKIGYRKGSNPTSPVLSDMSVVGPTGNVIGQTTVTQLTGMNVPALNSANLGSASYAWVTVWQDGWGSDPARPVATNNKLAIDAVRVDGPPTDVFQVKYSSNLTQGDSIINVTNTGVNGNSLYGPGYGTPVGNLCVNVYAFSPDEQLISCCSCLVTPNGLVNITANRDLVSNTLTGTTPNSIMVKLVATGAGANFTGSICTNSAALAGQDSFPLAAGMRAWGTTLHSTTNVDPPPAGTVFSITETPFLNATVSDGELESIRNRCTYILGNGSTFGQCYSCRAGGLGGAKL